jgi:4-amino-4-deoxy-L-arabinose transferase-like glycosyltransferase
MQAETGTDGEPTTRARMRPWQWVALALVASLSAFLNLCRLGMNGYGSHYYAAAVKSMLRSAHNLFFVAYDPAGFESVDKPPLGFWLQALFAKVLGFSGLSLLLPQALLGVLTVVALFFLVRRAFGAAAGLSAAAMMAMTPIGVATSRSNHLDVALTFTLVLAAWAGLLASEQGRLRWLLLSSAIVGLGFNVKMLEAYLVVPALAATYLFATPIPWKRRVAHLGLSAIVLAGVSVSWALVVDLTPASRRPYIDSTEDNSELGLAFGYNGVNRLLYAGAQAPPRAAGNAREPAASSPTPAQSGPPFSKEIGPRSPFRLLTQPLASQIGWWIPLSVLGSLALFWQGRQRGSLDPTRRGWLLFGVWLFTTLALFSSATFFHPYYLVTMAPPIAALSSAGLLALFRDYVDRPARDLRAWGLPVTVVLSAIFESHILSQFPGWSSWMSPCVLGVSAVAASGLLVARAGMTRRRALSCRVAAVATAGGAGGLLFPCLVWSLASLTYGANSDAPSGGPIAESLAAALHEGQRAALASDGGPFRLSNADERLLEYLEANQGEATYLVGSLFSNRISAPLMLASRRAVMSLGGYRGTTPILTVTKLKEFIQAGTIRFFHLPFALKKPHLGDSDRGGLAPLDGKNVPLVRWIQESCEKVPAERWANGSWVTRDSAGEGTTRVFRPAGQQQHIGGVPVVDQLFDCANLVSDR